MLTSSRTYTNPYADVTVSVVYTGPGSQQITGYGFWDGGNTFKLRAMLPQTGTWSWSTTSSDTSNTGLHGKAGTVSVTPYTGANLLYQNGYLKISIDNSYLTYANGSPFLWLGDTAWAAPIAATQAEWEAYIQKRKNQKFNVIQVHTGSGFLNRTTDRNGNPPFSGSGSSLQLNPAYWWGVEQKVQYTNDQGLLVFFTAVHQPGPGFPESDATQVQRFARGLAARMMGNFVVYSPVADDVWTSLADTSGNALQSATSLHLITVHPRFHLPGSMPSWDFHYKTYVDFVGLQSGNGWNYNPYAGARVQPFSAALANQRAVDLPLSLVNRSPIKPILNLEVSYDHLQMHQEARSGSTNFFQQPFPIRIPRSNAYLSMLSGTKGQTYGSYGIWNWGETVTWLGNMWDFATALNQPSADQMQYLFELFSGMEWWKLVPSHQLIQNQSTSWLNKMALSKTPDGKLGVAYLPDNPGIDINMSVFPGAMSARWFNPLTNAGPTETASVANSGIRSFTKPSGWTDAVLVLHDLASTQHLPQRLP